MRIIVTAFLSSILCVALLLSSPAPASAFGMSGVGGKLGYVTPENLDGTLAIVGHLEFEQPGSRLHLVPSVMYWQSNNLSDISANADLYYHFSPEGVVTPYVGAGLGLNFFNNDSSNNSSTDVGANVFGGVRIPASNLHYFLEGRYTASERSQFGILGGITIHTP